MLISGPEQKPIARLSPDGSQILYLVPPNPEVNGGQRRAGFKYKCTRKSASCASDARPNQRRPFADSAGGPNIINYQCSRAPAEICVLDQAEPKQFIFSLFDS